MKRRLAALLAGAMVLTSLPMVSFAASSNRVSGVAKVKDDAPITSEFIIKNEYEDIRVGDIFRLKLENAEWDWTDKDDKGILLDNGKIGLTYLDETTVEAKVYDTDNDQQIAKDEEFKIDLSQVAEATAEGEVKLTVDPRSSRVSSGTYTVAIAGDSATVVTVDSVEKFSDEVTLDTIEFDELYSNAIENNDEIKLTIVQDNDFVWVTEAGDTLSVKSSSGLGGEADVEVTSESDEETLVLKVKDLDQNRTQMGTLYIDGLTIKAERDADFGKVELEVEGDIADTTLEVAEYVDYNVSVSVDEEANITAGYGSEKYEITIEEGIASSWFSERRTLVKLPDNVRIVDSNDNDDDYEDVSKYISVTDSSNIDKENYNTVEDAVLSGVEIDEDGQWIEFVGINKEDSDKTTSLTFEVELEVKAGTTGDITATVSGTGLEEDMEVKLGEVETPFTVEVEPVELKTGLKVQEVGDIVITEAEEGILDDGTVLTFKLEDNDIEWEEEPEVKVDGDLEISTAMDDGKFTITVDDESREASTITLTGGKVKVDRSVPEGTYDLTISTSDSDWNAWGNWFDDVYVDIITPNTHDIETMQPAKSEASFTIGSKEFVVNGETVVADVAPYIANGRTMVSVKYAALGLGIDPANILYDASTRTVTVMDGDRILQMVLGSKQMTVNGAVINMDVASEVVDGRVFVPMSWLAKALNVDYTWDDATKTVTFN